jgi:hypothetical protein
MVQKILSSSADKKYLRVLNSIADIINKYIKQQRPKDLSLRNTRKHFEGCRIWAMNSHERIPTGCVTPQPAVIIIQEPTSTELV